MQKIMSVYQEWSKSSLNLIFDLFMDLLACAC